MPTLHVFGDSFSEGQPKNTKFPPFILWKKIRNGNLPKSWAELLSEKLKLRLINHAVGGHSNFQIFEDVCANSDSFRINDIVIINWTFKTRFRWAAYTSHNKNSSYNNNLIDLDGQNFWKKLSSNNDTKEDFDYISKKTKDDIVTNLMSPLYTQEIYNKQKLLIEFSKSRRFKIFFWSTDDEIINNLEYHERNCENYICADKIDRKNFSYNKTSNSFTDMILEYGGLTVDQETNYQTQDGGHLGEKGHLVQSELFYSHIMNYKISH